MNFVIIIKYLFVFFTALTVITFFMGFILEDFTKKMYGGSALSNNLARLFTLSLTVTILLLVLGNVLKEFEL